MLLRPTPATPVTPASPTRNRTGVAALAKRAPSGQHDLAWWLAWLAANW
jgi:hypothetical protein